MKKYELNQLLEYIIGIADGKYDNYAEDYERLDHIRDLCVQALGKEKELELYTAITLPKFKKAKSKKK